MSNASATVRTVELQLEDVVVFGPRPLEGGVPGSERELGRQTLTGE
jgi:hypothetical protein